MSIADNLHQVLTQIRECCQSCGRAEDEVTLVAVAKRFPVTAMQEAIAAGQLTFGENYVQEAADKRQVLGGQARIHFIGHLQSNKAKIAASLFDMIETVDSLRLAAALDKHLASLDKTMDILLQINLAGESQKSGLASTAAEPLLRELQRFPRLRPKGLMTMPPYSENSEDSRPYFRDLRQLAAELSAKGLLGAHGRVELSMGMSGDFRVAIAEGATIIRIGTAIFGQRQA